MNEGEAKELIAWALREKGVQFDEASLKIRYFEDSWDRLDAYGEFVNSEGYFEFAVSVEGKKKIKRFHVNMIMPRSVYEDMKKLKRE
ncbi:MAG: hypothetical protein RXQ70_03900 [Sulfolobaceae archaeon]|nr:hypothetical protein [Sulfolobales archaeon]